MSERTALVSMGVSFLLFLAVVLSSGSGINDIGVECVKAGNEWVRKWVSYECVRMGK